MFPLREKGLGSSSITMAWWMDNVGPPIENSGLISVIRSDSEVMGDFIFQVHEKYLPEFRNFGNSSVNTSFQ
jgi:hypothetical protein